MRQFYCSTSIDSQRATGLNKRHERRPPGLMGGASDNTNHHWRFEPSVRQRTRPSLPAFTGLSNYYERRPLGLWAEQAPIVLYHHLSRLEPSVRQCSPAVSWPPTPPSHPFSNHRHKNNYEYHPYPHRTQTFCQAMRSSPYLTKPRISAPPHPTSFPITSTVEYISHPYSLKVGEDVCRRVVIYQLRSSISSWHRLHWYYFRNKCHNCLH